VDIGNESEQQNHFLAALLPIDEGVWGGAEQKN